jgi:hypothetical protein
MKKTRGADLVDQVMSRGLGQMRRHIYVMAMASIVSLGLLMAPTASALTGHKFESSFGEAGHDSGQFELTSSSSVAVDEATHDVYVTDTGNHRVDEFSSAGAFIRAFGADVGGPGVDVCTIACVEGTPGSAPGSFVSPAFIAVDNSATGSGSVYVADLEDNAVTKFESDGTLVSSWGTGGQLSGFGFVAGVAVDSAGNLDVLNGETHVFQFEPDGTPTVAFETVRGTLQGGLGVDSSGDLFKVNGDGSVEKVTLTGSDIGQVNESPVSGVLTTTGITANPLGESVYLDGGKEIEQYDFNGASEVRQAGAPCSILPNRGCPPSNAFGAGHLTASAGLALDQGSGSLFVSDPGAQRVAAFSSELVPDAVIEEPTGVTATGATLNGTINPEGGPPATCRFQIVTKTKFGSEGFAGAVEAPCSPAGPFTGSGGEAVSAEVGGLSPGTTYLARLVASNSDGSYPDPTSKVGAASFLTSGPSVASSAAGEITATGATVTAIVEPHEEGATFQVEYGPTTGYGSTEPATKAAVEQPAGSGTVEEDAEGHLTRIKRVLMSAGAFYVGQEIGGLGIEAGTTIVKIQSQPSAPHGNALELTLSKPAEFGFFETTFSSPTAKVSQRLAGLEPGTPYHFRIVASSASATSFGQDETFTTLPRSSGGPLRAYELVTPAQKVGEPFPPEWGAAFGSTCGTVCLPGEGNILMPMQTDPDGEALAYGGQPFSPGLTSGANQYIARRSSSGWASDAVSPARLGETKIGSENGFKAFSQDLSRGVLLQTTPAPALSPDVPESSGSAYSDLYLWEQGSSALQPLITVKPPNRLPGPPEEQENGHNFFQLAFAGGNVGGGDAPAFSHLIFEANDALTPAVPGIAPAAPEVEPKHCGGFTEFNFPESDCDLYEWDEGQLSLVNVLPGNETAVTHAVIGAGRQLEGALASTGSTVSQAPDVDHAISADGSRVFWSDGSGQVYVRIDGRETMKIEDPGGFLTASEGGSEVLLTDGCLYSLTSESCKTMLGEQEPGSTFLGTLGTSSDLSVVYFVDTGVLAPGAHPESCQPNVSSPDPEEEEGKDPVGISCNLYVYEHGAVRYIGLLRYRDNNFVETGVYGAWKASPSNRVAQVTPDGQFLAFDSTAALTGYDNRQRNGEQCPESSNGTSCREIYVYDLASHSLTCASCNPSGQRPLGLSTLNLINPAPGIPFRQPEALPADGEGRVFFESQDALLPGDTNGHIADVYEWAPHGVGGCELTKGCLALISSGHSPDDSQFVTATPDAANVFFMTHERLVPQDQDDMTDVYDARIGGGITSSVTPACEAEGCKSQSAFTPVQAAAASSSFSGPGNQKPACKKGTVRKQGKCVKKKTNKKQPKKKTNKKPRKGSGAKHRASKSGKGGSK